MQGGNRASPVVPSDLPASIDAVESQHSEVAHEIVVRESGRPATLRERFERFDAA